MNIILACAAGMSTSLLVMKMQEAAKKANKDYHITAMSIDSFEETDEAYDVVLLGPQVGYRLEQVREMVDGKAPVEVIDGRVYGLCDGAGAIAQAEKAVKK
jgi:PTS system cellobiose-specific IIB component